MLTVTREYIKQMCLLDLHIFMPSLAIKYTELVIWESTYKEVTESALHELLRTRMKLFKVCLHFMTVFKQHKLASGAAN